MDVFTALQTSVSGLKAQSYSLGNISGNIANSQTIGYKRIDTSFVDMMADQAPKREVAGSVGAYSQLTNTIQGNLNATGLGTNMALNGDGFFKVAKRTSDSDGGAVFAKADYYTRRGDFAPDKDGYLVNGAGSYLMGSTIDPATGQVMANTPIRIPTTILPAKTTTKVTYSANLPKTPATANATSVKDSELLGTLPGSSPPILTGSATGNKIAVADAPAFMKGSIAGPSLTAYTADGTPVTVQGRWAKVQNADPATAGSTDVWNLYYAADSTVPGGQSEWTNIGQAFAFDAAGKMTAPAGGFTTDLTVDGTTLTGVAFDFGEGGLTAYASSNGTVTTNELQQDGFGAGTLSAIEVSEDGTINGSYSNGATLAFAKVDVWQFANADGLKPDSLGNYQQTSGSGQATSDASGTTVVGGNVEQSNTDIAAEFSKMIVTQQAYSANTRVISTAQTMISDLLNVIR